MEKNKVKFTNEGTVVHPLFIKFFGYGLYKSATLFKYLLDLEISKLDLILPQSGIIYLLSMSEGHNQNLLGREMGVDKTSMVKLIDDLEKKGLVTRMTDPADRRSKCISLTAKGVKLAKGIEAVHRKLEKRVFGRLGVGQKNALEKNIPKLLKVLLELK